MTGPQQGHLACARCGYPLPLAATEGTCPECAMPVAKSRVAHERLLASSGAVRAMAFGAPGLAIGAGFYLAAIGLVFASQVFVMRSSAQDFFFLLVVLGTLVQVAGQVVMAAGARPVAMLPSAISGLSVTASIAHLVAVLVLVSAILDHIGSDTVGSLFILGFWLTRAAAHLLAPMAVLWSLGPLVQPLRRLLVAQVVSAAIRAAMAVVLGVFMVLMIAGRNMGPEFLAGVLAIPLAACELAESVLAIRIGRALGRLARSLQAEKNEAARVRTASSVGESGSDHS